MLKGLIFTDTYMLSQNLRTRQSDIQSVLNQYVTQCSSYIEWYIVDVADSMYSDTINPEDWLSYVRVLTDFYYGLCLYEHNNCPLFIIGGVNEIPMPYITNPIIGAVGSEKLHSDMLYCFNYEGVSSITPTFFINQSPRFAVGRLPLSSQHTISDLTAYLDASLKYLQTGIYIRGAAMTTTESWLKASTDMMQDIPTVSLSSDNVPLYNRMIVSPLLDTTYHDMYEGFVKELQKIDFMICNLHGCENKGASAFLGQDRGYSYLPVAIQPSMLKHVAPVILNTVACFGARFTNYDINDSMLYTALQNGTMLYAGACDVSLGGGDQAGKSELLMKLYNIYLHKGIPAGSALLKAKQDYYRTCHEYDGDEYAMFTVLEFNLFGCPILSMQPKLDANYCPQLLGQNVTNRVRASYHPTKIVPVIGTAFEANDILAYVRGQVDTNLSYIRNKVEKEVYERLGLSSNNIDRISRIMQNEYQIGWQFVYMITPHESTFRMYYLVNTNEQGEITKIIHTK